VKLANPRSSTESIDVTGGVAYGPSGAKLYTAAGNMPGGALGLGGGNLPLWFVFSPVSNSNTLEQSLLFFRAAHKSQNLPYVPPANVQLDAGKAENIAVVHAHWGLAARPGAWPSSLARPPSVGRCARHSQVAVHRHHRGG